tara:strand:+ start:716 stop:958 length:243 start_codon:yes stop_codon:yes gene_type:complete
MISCSVQKNYFYNKIGKSKGTDKTKNLQVLQISKKNVVDINKLLNRVKLDQRNETKRKIVLFSLITLGLTFIGFFITILK